MDASDATVGQNFEKMKCIKIVAQECCGYNPRSKKVNTGDMAEAECMRDGAQLLGY